MSNYPRESFNIATKFPGPDLSNFGKAPEIFEKQLKNCKVDYFDFYLCHSLSARNVDLYLDKSIGTVEYLIEQKKKGRIRHLGLSEHSPLPVLERFLEAYGEHMEFCQIQLNYLDWTWQNAKEKVKLLTKYNIPIWVMEPLRGGKLANLSADYKVKLNEIRPDTSAIEFSFRFLQSFDNVTMILSGMSTLEQLKENIKIFDAYKPLDTDEKEKLINIGKQMMGTVPCTECKYCTKYCVNEIDIPKMIKIYNEQMFLNDGKIPAAKIEKTEEGKRPAACIACGKCEEMCPQNIKISEIMQDFAKRVQV